MKQKILIIVGPTASGKSALAVYLARAYGGQVISADSRQVYRGLDIGTGKITEREMKGVPHHLLDVASPKKPFSAADFRTRAIRAVAQVARMGQLPIVVGGTGYYIDALVGRLAVPEVPPDPHLRAKLDRLSADRLFLMLKKMDPDRAVTMDTPSERNNKRRIIRAIEIASTLGKVPRTETTPNYDVLWIGINPPFEILEQKIKRRLGSRLRAGMVAEAVRLHKGGLSYKRMEELGLEYRSLSRFLQNKITKAQMVAELEQDIRRYAKKQLMYWNRNSEIKWFLPKHEREIERNVLRWLQRGVDKKPRAHA